MLIRLLFLFFLLGNIGLYVYNREHMPETIKFEVTDSGVEKLILLSELEQESTIWEEPETNISSTEKDSLNQACYSLGAFETKAELQTTLDQLKNQVLKIRSREVVSSQEAGYWVYIPAMKTRDEALSVARELSEAQIKDYYVVTTGEHENTLSLGVYRDSDNANTRVSEIRNRGFQAEKEVRIEQWPEFWLDYSIQAEKQIGLEENTLASIEASVNLVECNW